ncbi:MAG: hypothetical protein OWQ48_00745 [Desulfurococcus sp.]|nr:hypothetical protein [Desulfurococcus sp.]
MEFTDLLAVLALSILAGVMIVWYYYWRRRMLWLMHSIVKTLEEVFKPVDKNYVLLGYLVGFKSEYKLDSTGAKRIYARLLLLPHYSLLYYPIARLLTSKVDRLDILVKEPGLKLRRMHVVKRGWLRLLKQDDLSVEGLKSEVFEHGGVEYYVYYEDGRDRDILVSLVKNHSGYLRVSSIPEENAILITMKAEPENIVQAAKDLVALKRSFRD